MNEFKTDSHGSVSTLTKTRIRGKQSSVANKTFSTEPEKMSMVNVNRVLVLSFVSHIDDQYKSI